MREKMPAKKEKKSSEGGRWLNQFLIFLAIFAAILLALSHFSLPDTKPFEIRKKENDIIEIYGLTPEEVEKIDWQKAEFADNFYGNNKQYRLYGEGKNFFKRLFNKRTIYHVTTELNPHEIREKELVFNGFTNKNKVKIHTTQSLTKQSLFEEEKSFSILDILKFIFYLVLFIVSLASVDMIFHTNFVGFLTYPFRFWKKGAGEVGIPKVGFKDVGGLQEAKEELGEVVSYFHNPQSFWKQGAKVPKGILLVGPPGNGKTLLAKAVAGECNLPFLFRSGSEFEEAVVGLGARRMRELFRQARSYPQGCIVFIDEIDAIGRKRYSVNAGHAEQTLNQLLNELDGFHPRDNIIILAATNSLNVLDSALLRPGRFDRQIYIPLPNLKGRREIIQLHARKIPLKSDVDLEEIAAMTKGLSGAQITNIFNEASILSIRYGKKFVDYEMIFEAHDRTLMGPSLTSQTLTAAKRKIIAYHEAGHAVIGLSLPETVVKKITIIPRWSAGGYTWIALRDEQGDDYLINKSQMLAHVMSFLGGRASEELVFGLEYITIGAYSDFKQAIEIIRNLILRYGMSDLGIIPTQENFFSNEEIPPELPETAKQKIEKEREKIMDQCWKKVKDILQKKRLVLRLLAEELLKKNSLQKEDINYIFVNQISPYIPLLN
jgi:cell division protease FtsH